VGKMSLVTRIDDKGRVLIPKSIRETIGIKERQLVRIKVVDGKIVLEPLRDIADEYYGAVKIKKWPRDLDEFLVEAVQKWWRRST